MKHGLVQPMAEVKDRALSRLDVNVLATPVHREQPSRATDDTIPTVREIKQGRVLRLLPLPVAHIPVGLDTLSRWPLRVDVALEFVTTLVLVHVDPVRESAVEAPALDFAREEVTDPLEDRHEHRIVGVPVGLHV